MPKLQSRPAQLSLPFHTTRRPRALALAIGAVLSVSMGVAHGQSASAQTGQLQEIVVTATRHEESLSKVAVSVSAFSQDTMDQKGI